MSDPTHYIERFQAAQAAVISGDESGFALADDTAVAAVAALGDGVHELTRFMASANWLAHTSLAIAADNARAFSSITPDGKPGADSGQLMLMAVTLRVVEGAAVPRQLKFGNWLPSLPDGRAVPGAVDFLLTFEEAYGPLSTAKRLHEILAPGLNGAPASVIEGQLRQTLGTDSPESAFDSFEGSERRLSHLRFLPAYAASNERPWFSTDDQMRNWQQTARLRLKSVVGGLVWPYLLAPACYRAGLLAGADLVLRSQVQQWATQFPSPAWPRPRERPDIEVSLQPFGYHGRGATSILLSAGTSTGEEAGRFLWFLTTDHERARWKESAERIADLVRDTLGLQTRVAPVVQGWDFLFLDKGARRLHVVLGSSLTFEGAPDGLPWNFPESEESKKWLELEKRSVETDGNLIVSTVESLLNLEPGSVSRSFSMVLFRGAWRPGHVLVLRGAPESEAAGGASWPLPENALEVARHTLCALLGRAWVWSSCAGE